MRFFFLDSSLGVVRFNHWAGSWITSFNLNTYLTPGGSRHPGPSVESWTEGMRTAQRSHKALVKLSASSAFPGLCLVAALGRIRQCLLSVTQVNRQPWASLSKATNPPSCAAHRGLTERLCHLLWLWRKTRDPGFTKQKQNLTL